jgi:hypothetical protein
LVQELLAVTALLERLTVLVLETLIPVQPEVATEFLRHSLRLYDRGLWPSMHSA